MIVECNVFCYISVNRHVRQIQMGRALYQMKLLILLSAILIVEGCQMDMKILDQRMIHCHLHQSRMQIQNIGEVMLDRNNRVIVVRWKVVLIARWLQGPAVLKGLLSVQHLFLALLFWFLVEEHFISVIPQVCIIAQWLNRIQFLDAYIYLIVLMSWLTLIRSFELPPVVSTWCFLVCNKDTFQLLIIPSRALLNKVAFQI